jgi:hypothetical protein
VDRAHIQRRRIAEDAGVCDGVLQRRAGAESLPTEGQTLYIGKPFYKKYDSAPIKLQAHGDKSEPLSFRNIWVRELN